MSKIEIVKIFICSMFAVIVFVLALIAATPVNVWIHW